MANASKTSESDISSPRDIETPAASGPRKSGKSKQRSLDKLSPSSASAKRRCVSTACIACRKRKSKCDGNKPSCAACSSVYATECIYDPNSDHRRKGVYKRDIDNLKTRNSTLQTLIQAILNFPEDEVPDLVKQIRTCESLDDVAESIMVRENGLRQEEDDILERPSESDNLSGIPQFERELSGKLGKVKLDNGAVSFIGGTSNLIYMDDSFEDSDDNSPIAEDPFLTLETEPITSWTEVTDDAELVLHLITMYFTWHYPYFTTLSQDLFWDEFRQGKPPRDMKHKTAYCTPLLVNAMLALGCHFTSRPSAREDPHNSATAGDHFFKEAKKLILENDEHENPRMATVQALALMSVREAGCGREARGWVYSGMSFRMAYDLGLNLDSGLKQLDESEIDARRITMWGCFLFDKCWSNYLGRQPQITLSSVTVPKFDVFPSEDAEIWRPYYDAGPSETCSQPARTRAIALQISHLCEISADLLLYFYHPNLLEKPMGKQAELKKLSELHTRLEAWRKSLPQEMEPHEGQLPNILVMHMFFQLLFIHLFRPFLKYKPSASPLPPHVSPRKFITHSATTISKLLRLYRRTYGLQQICNIVVYIVHMAINVHLLNLPDKSAQRDIQHGLNHLEEIAESWLCARRALVTLQLVARRWKVELPEAAAKTFMRVEAKYGRISTPEQELEPKLENTGPIDLPPILQSTPSRHPVRHPHASHPHQTSFFPETEPIHSPTSEISDLPNQSFDQQGILPQPASEYSHQSRPYRYISPHGDQAQPWQQPTRPPAATSQAGITSPTALFGGVQGLIQDQEWWLRDSNQFFANWNKDPQEQGSEMPAGSRMQPNQLQNNRGYDSNGNMELDLGSFKMNGID